MEFAKIMIFTEKKKKKKAEKKTNQNSVLQMLKALPDKLLLGN